MPGANQESKYSIRPLSLADQAWVAEFTAREWGSDKMIVHGTTFIISQLPGFIAEMEGEIAGLVTYHMTTDSCEIASLNSLRSGLGIGSSLIDAVKAAAIQHGCRRLFLSTTNDNIEALLFYQKRGFILAELRRGAVMEARKIKPQISLLGNHDLPIRDEIELEISLPFPGVI